MVPQQRAPFWACPRSTARAAVSPGKENVAWPGRGVAFKNVSQVPGVTGLQSVVRRLLEGIGHLGTRASLESEVKGHSQEVVPIA